LACLHRTVVTHTGKPHVASAVQKMLAVALLDTEQATPLRFSVKT